MTKKAIITAVAMPIVASLAYIYGNGGMPEFSSLRWLCATLASATFSLAIFNAEKLKGMLSARIYAVEVLFPFAWIAACSFMGLMPIYTIFAYLTLPVAMGCGHTYAKAAKTGSEIAEDLADRTATLQLMFTAVLSAVLLIF